VGFRFTCCSVARGYEVGGHVRNLADGRVEIVAEGESIEVDRFLAAIQLEMSDYIRNTEVETDSPGAEPLDGFSILH